MTSGQDLISCNDSKLVLENQQLRDKLESIQKDRDQLRHNYIKAVERFESYQYNVRTSIDKLFDDYAFDNENPNFKLSQTLTMDDCLKIKKILVKYIEGLK